MLLTKLCEKNSLKEEWRMKVKVETPGGDTWWRHLVETSGGDTWWRHLVETAGHGEWEGEKETKKETIKGQLNGVKVFCRKTRRSTHPDYESTEVLVDVQLCTPSMTRAVVSLLVEPTHWHVRRLTAGTVGIATWSQSLLVLHFNHI